MIYAYSVLLEVLYILLRLALPRHSKLYQQLIDRDVLLEKIDSKEKYVFAYVSSAGELDQVLPLASQLRLHGYETIIFCFSKSGTKFAANTNVSSRYICALLTQYLDGREYFKPISPTIVSLLDGSFGLYYILLSGKYTKKVCCIDVSFSSKKRSYLSKSYYHGFLENLIGFT